MAVGKDVQKMAILWLWLHPPGRERTARAAHGAQRDRPVVSYRAPLAVSSCTRHSKQQRRRRPKRCTSPPHMKSPRGRPRARHGQGLISPAQWHGIRGARGASRALCVLAQGRRRQARRDGRGATRARPGIEHGRAGRRARRAAVSPYRPRSPLAACPSTGAQAASSAPHRTPCVFHKNFDVKVQLGL